MESAHLLIIDANSHVIDREHLFGEGSMDKIRSRWLNTEIPKYSALGCLAYAQSERDFRDTFTAKLYLK